MLTMDQVHRIRELFYQQDMNLSEIADALHCDWRTVRKYVDKDDFNITPPNPEEQVHTSKLDNYKPIIDGWLIADKGMPRKQRHTARRVFNRLSNECSGFDCSYRLVATYVAEKKKQLRLSRQEGYLPLTHFPGEAQADFGTADFIENGHRYKECKYLVLSFPFSNGGYLWLNYGENTECLFEGLEAIFEHIGGVPTEIWFDNTRTIVTDIIKGGGREVTERFQRFAEHYRFKPVFMNTEAGWEKGNVESKVGYLRRNELVPIPDFQTLAEYNITLLNNCDEDMKREHYDKNSFISDLFQQDKKALIQLPSIPYDTKLYTTVNTDKYGKFTLDKGKHRYSASPAQSNTTVSLVITSKEVIVMDDHNKEVVRHRRLYKEDEKESMDWIPYLKYIARKPRSLRNSGIYDMMPSAMQQYMDSCSSSDRGQALKALAELTERSSFEDALTTVEEAVHRQSTDPDSLKSLYRRLFMDVPQLPPLNTQLDNQLAGVVVFRGDDLSVYDKALNGGAQNV